MSNSIEVITEKVSEKQLEALLMSDIQVIEEGMFVLGNQIDTRSVGELDVLAVDENGILNVIELKINENDSQLQLYTFRATCQVHETLAGLNALPADILSQFWMAHLVNGFLDEIEAL